MDFNIKIDSILLDKLKKIIDDLNKTDLNSLAWHPLRDKLTDLTIAGYNVVNEYERQMSEIIDKIDHNQSIMLDVDASNLIDQFIELQKKILKHLNIIYTP